MEAFQDVINYLTSGCLKNRSLKIAIFDATNTTRQRRQALLEAGRGVQLIFIESICTNKEILDRNYQMKLQSPDYKDMDPVKAREDFLKRVEEYERIYEPISLEHENSLSYIRLFNVGEHMELNKMHGYLPMEIVTYLGNIHIQPRKIYLLRHGQTENDIIGKLSAECDLTPRGMFFSHEAAQYVQAHSQGKNILLYDSTLRASTATASYFVDIPNVSVIRTRLLNELGGGKCDGLSYREIEEKYPYIIVERSKNKLLYRYPGSGGESYLDLIERLKPIILELERCKEDVVVVSHNAVIRVILGYFTGSNLVKIPYLELPRDTVIELSPGPFGVKINYVEIEMNEEEINKIKLP